MGLLKYVGNSPFGVSLILHDMRTKVTVSKDRPYKIEESIDESDIRYYESIKNVCDIVLEMTETKVVEEVVTEVEIKEEIVEEVPEVEVEVEPTETTEVTKESIYEALKNDMTSELVDEMATKLGVKSKKRNKDAKLWDIIESTDMVQLLEYIGGNN